MCDANRMKERLAFVSQERDRLQRQNIELREVRDQLAELLDGTRKERDRLSEVNETLTNELAGLREELDRLTNPGPEEPPTRSDILDMAKRCVCGDREQDYGSPEANFERIGFLWSIYLSGNLHNLLKPEDVAAMLALLKIARIASGHAKADNWVDLAGYAACGGELQGRQ